MNSANLPLVNSLFETLAKATPLVKKDPESGPKQSPAPHPVIGHKGTVGMMTAESPRFPSAEGGNKALEQDLTNLGASFHPVQGSYGGPENSYIIHGLSQDQMVGLGKKYGQEAVIHSDAGDHKLIYTNGEKEGQYHPHVGHEQWTAEQGPPEDFYTQLPDKSSFRLNFDFDKLHPLHPEADHVQVLKNEATAKNEGQVGSRIWGAWLKVLEFLRPGDPVSLDSAKMVLSTTDRDMAKAIAVCAGLEPTSDNLAMVSSIYELITGKKLAKTEGEALNKGEDHVDTGEPLDGDGTVVRPLELTATPVANAVQQAFRTGQVLPVKLDGKHSKGTFLATINGKTILLKHGSGPSSPAAGMKDERATQSARESCFWAIAHALGVSEFYPEAQWISVNGEEFAAIEFLSGDYQDLEEIRETNPKLVEQILDNALRQNLPHIWATIDYILGNTDSHAGNIMVKLDGDSPEGSTIRLIDHGSSFAGFNFAPGKDPATFVPFYLRGASPPNFKQLDPKMQLECLYWSPDPDAIGYFIETIEESAIRSTCQAYGLSFEPVLARLHRLQALSQHVPADVALNRLWLGLL